MVGRPECGVEMCGGGCGGGEGKGEVAPEIGGGKVGRELRVSEENANQCHLQSSPFKNCFDNVATCH